MPVEISIVIVNYNVKAFLQQCIYSVQKASGNTDNEIFVVDNNSVDDSVEMLKQNFPDVKLIVNKANMGFAYACNQAIKEAKGKYILLLNPDTVIKEDSLKLCTDFMNETLTAGALGVKMINGKGKFLPESKRSLPTAKSAFYKMFGLSSLFPKSRKFGKYQLKYLDKDKMHEVEVLSGAFMFIRKKVLDEIGLLDEKFFMYGEDIDLSFRIIEAGYKNYYFPKTTIIHYKGESTKKASFKYVKTFYNAMLIFANKHYKGRKQHLFRVLIGTAIYIRALIALLKRLFSAIYLPVLDFLSIYTGYFIIVPVWEYYKFSGVKAYSDDLLNIYVPIYIFIWQLLIYYFTNYDLKSKFRQLIKGVSIGTIIILAVYSLLPENYRYSRALIIFGAVSAVLTTILTRLIIRIIANSSKSFSLSIRKKALLVGHYQNNAVQNYTDSLNKHYEICNQISYAYSDLNQSDYINLLKENIKIYKIETLIFFIKDLSTSNIIDSILAITDKNIEFKIVLPESSSFVGGKSIINTDKLPHFKINPISKPINKLRKRVLDIIISLLFLIGSPIFLLKNKAKLFYKTIWKVVMNRKSWVSYAKMSDKEKVKLPALKPGIFSISFLPDNIDQELGDINQIYAKNYRIVKDLIVIFKALRSSINLLKHTNN